MPNYSSLSTQVTAIKSEISSGLAASQYSAQDLVYVAKALEALSHVVAPDGVDNITVTNNIYLGATAESFASTASLTYPTLVVEVDNPDFSQIAFRNKNSGVSASTDLILYSNNGNDASGYIDMGITSSNFADAGFTATGKGDGYIFMVGASSGNDDRGNLVLATDSTGTQNKIVFAAGGLASNNTQMTITPDVSVAINIATASTSPTTGALTVAGGVGINGDVNINGAITFGGAGTSVSTANLSVTDPLLFVGNANAGDAVDLGFIGEYSTSFSTITKTVSNKAITSNVATITTSTTHGFAVGDYVVLSGVDSTFNGTYLIATVPTTTTFTFAKTNANVTSAAATGSAAASTKRRFGGIARDASDGVIKVFEDATTKPTSTINFSEAGLVYGDFQVGAFTASSAVIGNVSNTELQYLDGVTSAIQTQLDTKAAAASYAALASPTLTGTPAAPTAPVDTNTTQIATTAYVVGQGYLKSSTASGTYAPLTSPALNRPVFTSPLETITVSATAATGTVAVDVVTSGAKYYTSNASADWTFNFRGDGTTTLNSLLATGQAITVAFLVTNGASAYRPTAFQVDGSVVTPKWSGGTAPAAGSANSIDSYTFTIIKTANATFTVLGSQSKFA
jgi:hypothetical protein